MKTAAISDVKNRLSHYLRAVAKGETVTILDRGRPVALLKPLERGDGVLEELTAAGNARPPLTPLPSDFLRRKLPKAKKSVVAALQAERRDRF